MPAHSSLRALREAAASMGRTWRHVHAGDRYQFGQVELRVLHPPPPDWERPRVRNDDSIVMELRYGDVSILLPGDIGQDVESLVADRLDPVRWRIVKVPHHGSGSSSSAHFVAATRPTAVIVSAGLGNRYGHPVPAVVDRYRAAGAAIFRTAERGVVTVTTDGRSFEIGTMTGRRWRVTSAAP